MANNSTDLRVGLIGYGYAGILIAFLAGALDTVDARLDHRFSDRHTMFARFDWFQGSGTPFNGKTNQQLAAIDAILQF